MKSDIKIFDIKKSSNEFMKCPFTWTGYGDELILFDFTCDVHFISADRQAVHLTTILTFHVLWCVGTGLTNNLWCSIFRLVELFSNLYGGSFSIYLIATCWTLHLAIFSGLPMSPA